jgi:hypothetical protein
MAAAKEQDFGGSGTYPRSRANGADFADQQIAEQFRATEYSWEGLSRARKREVMAMVHRSQGQRRARRVAIVFGMALAILAVAAFTWYLVGGFPIH